MFLKLGWGNGGSKYAFSLDFPAAQVCNKTPSSGHVDSRFHVLLYSVHSQLDHTHYNFITFEKYFFFNQRGLLLALLTI